MRSYLQKTRFLLLVLVITLSGCTTGHYTPLGEAGSEVVEQLKENTYRVEYRVGALTSQEQLDSYLPRRCAELSLSEGESAGRLGRYKAVAIGGPLLARLWPGLS